MPKKRNSIKYPEGWELIEPTLRQLDGEMREAELDPHDGKRKCEALWPIFRINHQKSRYVFDLYYRRKEISQELYEFCLDQNLVTRGSAAYDAFNLGPQLRHHMRVQSAQASERREGDRVRALWLQGMCQW